MNAKAPRPDPTDDADVFAPTEKGNRQLKSADTKLSGAELQLLVLVDGVADVAEIAKRAPEVTREALGVALRKLVADKLIICTSDLDADDGTETGFATIAVPA